MGKFLIQCILWATWIFVSRFLYLHTNYDLFQSIGYGFLTVFVMCAIIGTICVCVFGISTINYQIGGNDCEIYRNAGCNLSDLNVKEFSGKSFPTEYDMKFMLPQTRPAISVVNDK